MNEVIKCRYWWKLEENLKLEKKIFRKDFIPLLQASSEKIGKDYVYHYYDNDLQDISFSKSARAERTNRHQALVRQVASILSDRGYKLYEGIMDCAAILRSST